MPEEGEGPGMAVLRGFRAFPLIGSHEESVRVRQGHDKGVDPSEHASHADQGLAEVHLGFPRGMSKEDVQFLGPLFQGLHSVSYGCLSARVAFRESAQEFVWRCGAASCGALSVSSLPAMRS